MEHTALDPFVPTYVLHTAMSVAEFGHETCVLSTRISLYRTAAAIFELHVHFSSTVSPSDVQIVPHGNYFTISGVLAPRVRWNSAGVGILMWTDQPCGKFGRDVGINLSPGTEV
jgi:hypothetical protein